MYELRDPRPEPYPDELAVDALRTMCGEVGFPASQDEWHNAKELITATDLTILGHPVMEDWELPYMKALVASATLNGGEVLEIGFGMGISANLIQQSPGVTKHVIIEANQHVAARARAFAATAEVPVEVIQGFRDDVLPKLDRERFNGILNDTYPLKAEEVNRQELCARGAHPLLAHGGVLTYFAGEPRRYRPLHLKTLVDAGFRPENIRGELVQVYAPASCKYWPANVNTILAPRIFRD
jgi:guanidinoacetate N-methyltransferase